MKITKRQLRRIIAEEFRSREGKRLTRARYDELTDELDELYARLEKAKTMQEPNRSAQENRQGREVPSSFGKPRSNGILRCGIRD